MTSTHSSAFNQRQGFASSAHNQPQTSAPSAGKSDPLADLRKQVAGGKSAQTSQTPQSDKTQKPADRAINPHELDALYQAGTLTVVGSNSHYAGLRAVYDAGAKR